MASIISPFKIKSINMLSTSVYNLPCNTECTICRCNLNNPSLYKNIYDGLLKSNISIGKCSHSFHTECIDPWIKKNSHCPICIQTWSLVKNI